jgi:hypothetical protein
MHLEYHHEGGKWNGMQKWEGKKYADQTKIRRLLFSFFFFLVIEEHETCVGWLNVRVSAFDAFLDCQCKHWASALRLIWEIWSNSSAKASIRLMASKRRKFARGC